MGGSLISADLDSPSHTYCRRTAFCVATSRPQADQIVDRLKTAGFSHSDISALINDKGSGQDFAREENSKALGGVLAGAGTGIAAGGALGWFACIGALAIPGIGPLIAAGPILAALSGATIGATVGGITGGLIGLGIPKPEARRCEDKLKDGDILISVHTESSEESTRAKGIFAQARAEDVAVLTRRAPARSRLSVT